MQKTDKQTQKTQKKLSKKNNKQISLQPKTICWSTATFLDALDFTIASWNTLI